ncbi:hypothetical protein ACFQ69_35950 [Streptomyces sp. NPDC056470]|uniref:hypothetical protein n=1 Tax=Streptomyces sp. NPDC056470 TaxID=3345831 RepID=UPI0036CD4994
MHADDQVADGVSVELAELLRHVDDRPVKVSASVCIECGSRVFSVNFDELEGGAERECLACGNRAFIADSAEYWEATEPGPAECPCGSREFEVAVALSLADDGSVQWITVGLQCQQNGEVVVCVGWKINYRSTDHLLNIV